MMAANRDVERDWAEFESYATNLYARSIVINQPAFKLDSEQQSSTDNTQCQTNTSQSDVQSITEEMISVRKALSDLRTYSEEVR
jgi:hypothetical protein